MRRIRTVLGDLPPEALGATAAHEHLWCDQRLCREVDFPGQAEKMVLQDVDLIAKEAGHFHAAGGQAIIEVTVHGWGRDVSVLAEISRRTGLHVVATSGFYVEACHPDFVREASLDELTQFLVREITQGADGTPIRAGLLKASVSGARIQGLEEKCSRAVARAHLLTGAAITTHTSASARFHIEGGNAGTMFLDLFAEEGVDLARVIIGHCDENADLRQLKSLIARGAYVQFDVIGKEHWLLDATRADLIAALIAQGHGDRLLLSSDRNRVSELKAAGGPGYDHVLRHFVPLLQARGLSAGDIERLLVGNPATIFSMPVAEDNASSKR